MAEMYVRLEWDGDDLGPAWMNEDNLKLLLYTDLATKESLVSVDDVTQENERLRKALQQYADESNWEYAFVGGNISEEKRYYWDGGGVAPWKIAEQTLGEK